jgi:autotransporter strand-loop-strand O-heptosyltransferase
MKEILTKNYNEITPSWRPYHKSVDENNVKISFLEGAKVEVAGETDKEYEIIFTDLDANRIVYSTKIKTGMWSSTSLRYFINWKVDVKLNGEIVKQEVLNLKGKNVKVICDTTSMGDLLAYIGAIDAFQKKHQCDLYCVVFEPTFNKIFKENYSNIKFLATNDSDSSYYASYRLGYYYEDWEGKIVNDPKKIPLSTIASSILGFGGKEFKPKIKFEKETNGGKKYVCIGVHSTAQFKYWNRQGGWDEVVKYMTDLGYEVWCIDKFKYFGNDQYKNSIPNGTIDKTGNVSIEERMKQLSGADFFIGLTSGLSWLAWSVGIPVIMISGISDVWTEFYNPFRVAPNKNVCNCCANEIPFNKSKWDWCPREKNFECTKEISSDKIIEKINDILDVKYSNELKYVEEDNDLSIIDKFIVYEEFFKKSGTVYEKFFKVEKNDVVVDIGGHKGWFSLAASKRSPKKIFVLEPSKKTQKLIKEKLDIEGVPYTLLNVGISDKKIHIKNGLHFTECIGIEDFFGIPFSDFIKDNDISTIDFMKVDCEGGEYSIFTEENFDWISKNVKKVAGEWHLSNPDTKNKFINFRDKYLKKFKNYRVYSFDGATDIKWDLFNNDFVDKYTEILVYIDLRGGLVDQAPAIVNSSELKMLITGVSGGLGQAFESVCVSKNIEFYGQANKNNNNGKYQSCNFSDLRDVAKMEEYISKNNINCLINNAGVYSDQNIVEISDAEIQNMVNINLVTPILLSKYLYKHLSSTNQSGWIININSLAGKYPNYKEAVYCSTKFGLSGFGSSLSINQKNSKIKVVDVYVGAIKTEMTKDRPNHAELMDPQEIASFIVDLISSNNQYVPSSIEIRNTK